MIPLATLLPRKGDEAYKYTSFAAVARREYAAPQAIAVDRAALPPAAGARLVFVDGHYDEGLSDAPAGVVQQHLPAEASAQAGDNALYRMNATLGGKSMRVTLADGATVELLFVASDHPGQFASQPHVTVEVAANAHATLIERHHALGEAADFTNLVTELEAGPGARVTHLLVQQAAPQATLATGLYATLAEGAHLDSHAVQLGGALVRADIAVRLAGRGAHCGLYGFHLAGMRQHIDTHTRIDHLVPDTASDEHYRAVVDRGGRSVFNGKVVVAEGADRTDAQQYNANLLLSEQAEADTKPELEIYADDVKCAHGATVGKLDETALFYLRSRGIGEDAARSVLVWAFAKTILGGLPHEALRSVVEGAVLARLPDSERIQEFL